MNNTYFEIVMAIASAILPWIPAQAESAMTDSNITYDSNSEMLSREQAVSDVDALIEGISNVHPDMFSVCPQVDFFRAIRQFKQSIPDSIGISQLYLGLTPIVAMLGDGHTHLLLPEEQVLKDSAKFLPAFLTVTPEKTLRVKWSVDNTIPENSIIISVNGIPADSIIRSMMPLVSGEREHFKLMRIDNDFTGLFHLMYPADKYVISYSIDGSSHTATLYPMLWGNIKVNFDSEASQKPTTPYDYTVDSARNLAIMDFRSFHDEAGMKNFADSMFREIREKNIGNLIIDLRNNGGGNSLVGDILLRYISPEPFIQMDRILTRITPLTAQLLNEPSLKPRFELVEIPESDYIRPLSADEGFYNGNVYLLTSPKTFSAAASFAWTFSQCAIGSIIGEETGGMNVSYGDKVWYRLPASGLECGISFKRFWQFRADESSIHGATPDIHVSASDALQKAMSLIVDGKEPEK